MKQDGTGIPHEHHKVNEEALEEAIKHLGSNSEAELSDLDAVTGASLGVEGIIEYGRKVLEAEEGSSEHANVDSA